MKTSNLALLFCGSLSILACSARQTVIPPDDTTSKSGTISKGQVGASCSGVGTSDGAVAAFDDHDECPADICVADARGDDFASYCSADCSKKNCPSGYECIKNKFARGDDPKNVCVKADPDAAGDDDDDDDAPTGTIPASDVGDHCSGVGTSDGSIAAFGGKSACPGDICVADARGDDFDTYCSADCSKKKCPSGYTCEVNKFADDDDDPKKFCAKDLE